MTNFITGGGAAQNRCFSFPNEIPLSKGEKKAKKQSSGKDRKTREQRETPLRNQDKRGYNPVLQNAD